MALLYDIFIAVYRLGARLAATGNTKAAEWISGRKKTWQDLESAIRPDDRVIWVHSASAGEFEQAKPVIESLKAAYPGYKVLVTFFSPSGYRVARKYKGADVITYLPEDTAANAQRFVAAARPSLVIFVKYDFWYHHLAAVHRQGIPLLLISSIFRPDQLFFKWYGGFYKGMLRFFSQIFVQDGASLALLRANGIGHVRIGGDTRFDRVAAISGHFTEVPHIGSFAVAGKTVVAGSTWPGDEALLSALMHGLPADHKLIIAPHEIQPDHIENIARAFPRPVRYSQLAQGHPVSADDRTLIIDNIGMLSRLYHYGTITYIGGGFTKSGIHNTLEAAVYGKPVLFGPNFRKFREAKELIAAGGGFSIGTEEELQDRVQQLLADREAYEKASAASRQFIQDHKGATEAIMNYIYENRLLTR